MMTNMKLSILGTDYTVIFKTRGEDKLLEECDGYTDWTVHQICILDPEREDGCVADLEVYKKKVLRHEITHAFFSESGLMNHANQSEYGGGTNDEQIVDWIAIQGPKLLKVWKDAGCLE